MGIEENRATGHALLEQLRSTVLHLSAAAASLDASIGIASTTGESSVGWDMGLRVGSEVQRRALAIRFDVVGSMGRVEELVDRVEEYLEALGS